MRLVTKVYLHGLVVFEYHAESTLRLRLAAWVGRGILQRCPLGTVIIIALNLVHSDCAGNRRFSVNPNPRSQFTLSIEFEVNMPDPSR